MKKILSILLAVIVLATFAFFAVGSSGGGSSSSSSSYDRDAEYVGDAFGRSSDDVKDSVGALGEAMR